MQSILQILKVNEPRVIKGRDGRGDFQVQDAECVILKDTGEFDQVGVLRVPRELLGQVKEGVYIGSFALKPSYKDRIIEAVLTGLQPYTVPQAKPAKA